MTVSDKSEKCVPEDGFFEIPKKGVILGSKKGGFFDTPTNADLGTSEKGRNKAS